MVSSAALLRLFLRRWMSIVLAVLLASSPGVMALANSSVEARAGATSQIDVLAVLADDTPDLGPMRDAPPPMMGGINLLLTGVVPDAPPAVKPPAGLRQPWSVIEFPFLTSWTSTGVERPPKG